MRKSRSFFVLAAIVVAMVALSAVYFAFPPTGQTGDPLVMTGSLFISDAGQSHGGFEYTASYNVTARVTNGVGSMSVDLAVGLGDALTKHQYSISDFQITNGMVTMTLDGHQIELPWASNDTVWGHEFDGHYIASWGPSSPVQELRGVIAPEIFPGVPGSYYVELRLA